MTELNKISQFAASMLKAATLDDLLWSIAENVGSILNFDDCVIYLNVNNVLIQKAAFGIKNPKRRCVYKEIAIPLGQGIVGAVAQSKSAEIVPNTSDDIRYIWDQFSGNSEITVPVIYENQTIGIIDSESSDYDAYTECDKELLQIIANIAAPRIASAQYFEQLMQSQRQLEKTNHDLAMSLKKLKENQQTLIQSAKMASIGLLSAGVAHEINNPLGFSISNIESLAEYHQCVAKMYHKIVKHPELPEKIAEEIHVSHLKNSIDEVEDIINETGDGLLRIKHIVADLCGYARNEAKELGLFDVNNGIKVASNLLRGEVKNHCKLELDLGMLPNLYGNETKIHQVFMNIMHNAIQASQSGGLVAVETYKDTNFVYIDISDNGIGISGDNLQDIFTPFYTTKPIGQGTGLGLFICYRIVTEEHNGKIQVFSDPKKTTFRISLPIAKDPCMQLKPAS
jgi:signal transduction histidine kinase